MRKRKIIKYCELYNERNLKMLGDEENVTDNTNTCLSFSLEFQQLNVFVEDIKIRKTVLEKRG